MRFRREGVVRIVASLAADEQAEARLALIGGIRADEGSGGALLIGVGVQPLAEQFGIHFAAGDAGLHAEAQEPVEPAVLHLARGGREGHLPAHVEHVHGARVDAQVRSGALLVIGTKEEPGVARGDAGGDGAAQALHVLAEGNRGADEGAIIIAGGLLRATLNHVVQNDALAVVMRDASVERQVQEVALLLEAAIEAREVDG